MPNPESIDVLFVRILGDYEVAPNERISFSRDGDMLVLQRAGRPAVRLQYSGAMRFGLWTVEARFIADAARTVQYATVSEAGTEVVARRIK